MIPEGAGKPAGSRWSLGELVSHDIATRVGQARGARCDAVVREGRNLCTVPLDDEGDGE